MNYHFRVHAELTVKNMHEAVDDLHRAVGVHHPEIAMLHSRGDSLNQASPTTTSRKSMISMTLRSGSWK